jgi:hypothetical protein
MDVELLRQIGQRHLALDGGQSQLRRMPLCGSGAVVCSSSLLFGSDLGRCQVETPLIPLCRFPAKLLPHTRGRPYRSMTQGKI